MQQSAERKTYPHPHQHTACNFRRIIDSEKHIRARYDSPSQPLILGDLVSPIDPFLKLTFSADQCQ